MSNYNNYYLDKKRLMLTNTDNLCVNDIKANNINVNDKSNLNYVNVCNNLVVEGDTTLTPSADNGISTMATGGGQQPEWIAETQAAARPRVLMSAWK